jgi:sister chromatid cohesion protein DCC1
VKRTSSTFPHSDFFCCSVHIKGEPDEEAVLCTSQKTFAVKFVGSSNTMFIMAPDFSEDSQGCGGSEVKNSTGARALISFAAPGYMELVETAPRLETLKMLLSRNKYDQVSFERISRYFVLLNLKSQTAPAVAKLLQKPMDQSAIQLFRLKHV